MEPDDPKVDEFIREALRSAESKGRLEAIAAVSSFPGGIADLRKIMRSTEPLSLLDRALLVVYFGRRPKVPSVVPTAPQHMTNKVYQ